MSSLSKVEPSPFSSQKKRAFDALERRFTLERAELVQEEQHKKKKELFTKKEGCAETKIDENLSATPTLSSSKTHLPHSKKGKLECLGTNFQRQSFLKTGKDFQPAYSDHLKGIDEKLLNCESNVSKRGDIVNKVIYDLLQHGEEWNKFRRTSLKRKIDHCILLDNFVPNVTGSMGARGKALQSHSKRSRKHMSLQQHRKCGSFDMPKELHRFELFKSMHDIWKSFILEHMEVTRKKQLAQFLLTADLHGAFIVVVECKTTPFVGVRGIMIRETTKTFGILKQDNHFRVVPKHGSVFMFQAGCWKVTLHGDKLSSRTWT